MITLQAGDHWICQNKACEAEISVVISSELDAGTNPRCSCGSTMKKSYSQPKLRPPAPKRPKGSFLRRKRRVSSRSGDQNSAGGNCRDEIRQGV